MSGRPVEIHERGDDGYERLRLAPSRSVDWNARRLDRYPDAVVVARSIEDVQAAVRLARERGLKAKARSGGHSWADTSVRDGILVDLSHLDELVVDPASRTAVAGPGIKSQELNPQLTPYGLYFPNGGCEDVGLGGFVLQGGFGYNGGQVGMACESVTALDIVTADGELIHADETEHADWFWAARGSGSGFFGIVVRLHLRLHPLPPTSLGRVMTYELQHFDAVARWQLGEMQQRIPTGMQLVAFIMPKYQETTPGATQPVIQVIASYVSDDRDETPAREALALLDSCPVVQHALSDSGVFVNDPNTAHEITGYVYPLGGLTFVADNIWIDAEPEAFVSELEAIVRSFPTKRSHMLIAPHRDWYLRRPETMAFSMLAKTYIAIYAVKDLDDDIEEAALVDWTTRSMRSLEPVGKGIQLADENLVARRFDFMSRESFARLERLRAEHDPEGRFHSYLMAPGPADTMA